MNKKIIRPVLVVYQNRRGLERRGVAEGNLREVLRRKAEEATSTGQWGQSRHRGAGKGWKG